MASPNMHLAIAKKYMEKNSSIDSASFLSGTIYPDVTTYISKSQEDI